MKGPSPLLGYNTNVRHDGKLYHIQTEDSGVRHPHVITHLFADGGRIVASKKTTYTEHVGAEDFQAIVKKLMRAQHKEMFIALRDGVYDEEPAAGAAPPKEASAAAVPAAPVPPAPAPPAPASAAPVPEPSVDIDLDIEEAAPDAVDFEAAAAQFGDLPGTGEVPRPAQTPGLYQSLRPAVEVTGRSQADAQPESIFGSDLLSEKSLDEVILSYLAEDIEETDEG